MPSGVLLLARIIHYNRIADGHTVADWLGRTEVWRARSTVMGTLGGFASPFGPPPTTSSPLASLGLAKPSRDAALPAKPAGSAQR
jgi:hypothetical protein